jgi:hypothetical protein
MITALVSVALVMATAVPAVQGTAFLGLVALAFSDLRGRSRANEVCSERP